MNEFYHMLGDPAHWAFEILVTILFDGILAGLFYPILRNCWRGWRATQPQESVLDEYTDFAGCCALQSRLPIPESKIDLCTGCGDVRVLPEEEKK